VNNMCGRNGTTTDTAVDIPSLMASLMLPNRRRVLSDAGLFLQHPRFHLANNYESPHYLHLSDCVQI